MNMNPPDFKKSASGLGYMTNYEPTQNPPEDTGDDVSQTQARQNWKKIFAVKRFLRFSLTYIAMIH